jgi:hypothetical protein
VWNKEPRGQPECAARTAFDEPVKLAHCDMAAH